jgi:integral membrane protein (TIGR01906 family)
LRKRSGGRWLRGLVTAVFYVALPVLLITTNVRFAFSEERVYKYSIDFYDVPSVTHIPRADLIAATEDIRAYFDNSADYLRTKVHDQSGTVVPLFSSKEVLHMHDVKALVRRVYALGTAALAALAAYVAGVYLWGREEALTALARRVLKATAGTVAAVAVFGVLAAAGGFDALFTRFHELSFGNNFWQLDPARDHLVQMFPQDFWLASTMLIAGMTLLECALLGGVALLYLRHHSGADAAPVISADDMYAAAHEGQGAGDDEALSGAM